MPTVGYRFVGQLRTDSLAPSLAPEPAALPVPATGKRSRGIWIAAGTVVLAAAAGAALIAAWNADSAPRVASIRQITKSPAADVAPSLSPDGSQIAFGSNRSGQYEIYVRSLASDGVDRRLTSDGQENNQPSWSPDGRYIAYTSSRPPAVKIVPASGGPARFLTRSGGSPRWSPDGRSILLISSRRSGLKQPASAEPESGWGLSLVDVASGDVTPLLRANGPPTNPESPHWSADGKYITFESLPLGARVPENNFWILDVASGKARPLAVRTSAGAHDPVLSPDAKYLYYADFLSQIPGIWRARLGPDFTVREVQSVAAVEGARPAEFSITPDGRRIAFVREAGDSGIFSLALDARGAAAGEAKPIVRDRNLSNAEPHLSADGTRLVYNVQQGDAAQVIYVANSDGSNQEAITPADQHSIRPNWVGDELTVAYAVRRNQEFSFWIAPLHGTPERVTPSLDLSQTERYRLSRDGTRIAAHMGQGNLQIVTAPLRGGPMRILTPRSRNISFPCWSPDGKWLAGEERIGMRSTLVIVPSGGGEIRTVPTDLAQNFPFDWSPDSTRILFAGFARGAWNVYWVTMDGSRVEQLTHYAPWNGFVRYPTWSPRGDRVLFEKMDATSNIYIVELAK